MRYSRAFLVRGAYADRFSEAAYGWLFSASGSVFVYRIGYSEMDTASKSRCILRLPIKVNTGVLRIRVIGVFSDSRNGRRKAVRLAQVAEKELCIIFGYLHLRRFSISLKMES